MQLKDIRSIKRQKRIRSRVSGTEIKPRLRVYRSNKYIYAQLNTVFEEYGVKAVGEVGENFDHNIHDSIEMVVADKKEDDHKIAEVIQKGYKLGDRVIRPARVNVFEYSENTQ
jgi:molecular chaperone GrpE (heat shock protein)